MNLARSLVFIDVESTGVDIQLDRIIELGLLVYDGQSVVLERVRRFNPGIPIKPEATEKHGITDADVANEPPFCASVGRGFLKVIEGRDLAGYNLARFDLPIIDEELRRVGLYLNLSGVKVVDVQGIYFRKDPRTLSDAVRRYCGREHDQAHQSVADVRATLDVLNGQLIAHPDLAGMSVAELAEYSANDQEDFIDVARKLYRDADGDACYAFGKNRDKKVRDDRGYAHWMLKADFPGSTREALARELERLSEQVYAQGLQS